MDINKIKEAYKNLPHVTDVWIKNNEVYLVSVEGGIKHSLLDSTGETEAVNDEIISDEKPQTKKTKTKK